MPSDRTGSVARCYSLCSSPFTDDPLTVTVKRTADGYASNWLCDNAHAGMKMHVLAPSGTFVPKTLDTDFLLLAAGSGITPMMAICKSALAEGSGQVDADLRQPRRELGDLRRGAARAGGQVPRPADGRALAGIGAGPAERGRAGRTGRAVSARHEAFICGPGPFMAAAEEALKASRAAAERIHIEVFKSLESDPFAAVVIEEDDSDEGPATGDRRRSTARPTRCRWPRNAKLLDVLLDKGLDAPFSCREGHCGACAVLKKSGDVEMEVNDVLEQQDLDEGLILACQARPRSDSVEVTYDE